MSGRAFVLAFVTTKGGSGKSTLAANIAIAAVLRNRKVLILDCDTSQKSIRTWMTALRGNSAPVVRAADYETLQQEIEAAHEEGFELIVIDVPPTGGKLVQLAISIADYILVPVRGTMFDLQALRDTVELLSLTANHSRRNQGIPTALPKAAVVLNAMPAKASKALTQDIYASVSRYSIQVIGQLCERAAFVRSLNNGLGVTEWEANGEAAKEIWKMYRHVREIEEKLQHCARADGRTS